MPSPNRAFPSRLARKPITVFAIAASAILITSVAPPATAFARPALAAKAIPAINKPVKQNDPDGFYDSRRTDPAAKLSLDQRADTFEKQPTPGVRRLRAELGAQGVLAIDPLTATPRNVAKINGFLTGPSRTPAASIALDYIRGRSDVFRLTAADIANLTLRKDYVDIGGTHHLSFTQSVAGIPAFGNGLKANVTKDGKLVNITGSVAPGAAATRLPSGTVTADGARALSAKNVSSPVAAATSRRAAGPSGSVAYSNGDTVTPTAFITGTGANRGWQTMVRTADGKLYHHIIDATSGKVLFRQSLSRNDRAEVYDNYPGAPYGGKPVDTNLKPSWLPNNSPRLAGNVGHVYADVNGNLKPDQNEETPPSGKGEFRYPLKRFFIKGTPCDKYVCTWDPNKPGSWKDNINQGSTQMMYMLGRIHDTFAAAPIGFTREAGNFEAVDGDGVQTRVFGGAATPNGPHAGGSFLTPPDGQAPSMNIGMSEPPLGPAAAGANDPTLLFHEYGHGLSSRLVITSTGWDALHGAQANAMGEAWGDWYGIDYLANNGHERDTTKPGEILVSEYLSAGKGGSVQPIDCPVGAAATACPGTKGAGTGGFTFGDFGTIIGAPEVHADGQIWSQTLWDLRTAIGANRAESVVTRAMELSPENPSFLDMRNAILQADLIATGGRTQPAIWKVFAGRGMGFFANARDGFETNPVEDFTLPPAKGTPTGSLTGTITDKATKKPIAGVTVTIGGHDSGFPGGYRATTDANGTYTISGIHPGTYPLLTAGGSGYDSQSRSVSVPARESTINWALDRNWAMASGGATVAGHSGEDMSNNGCGPGGFIDGSPGSGWNSRPAPVNGIPTPQNITIKLPKPVTISRLSIDPDAGCSRDPSSATRDYKVETSIDGKTWTTAATGAFADANRGKLNPVTLAPGGEKQIGFVRYTMVAPQVPGDFGETCAKSPSAGCFVFGSAELSIQGTTR